MEKGTKGTHVAGDGREIAREICVDWMSSFMACEVSWLRQRSVYHRELLVRA